MEAQTSVDVLKPKRSVELTAEQKEILLTHVKQYSTLVDAAISVGIDRTVLERVLLKGSCAEKTFEKIKEKLFS